MHMCMYTNVLHVNIFMYLGKCVMRGTVISPFPGKLLSLEKKLY